MLSRERARAYADETPGNQLGFLPSDVLQDKQFLNLLSHAGFMSLLRRVDDISPNVMRVIEEALEKRAETDPQFKRVLITVKSSNGLNIRMDDD